MGIKNSYLNVVVFFKTTTVPKKNVCPKKIYKGLVLCIKRIIYTVSILLWYEIYVIILTISSLVVQG